MRFGSSSIGRYATASRTAGCGRRHSSVSGAAQGGSEPVDAPPLFTKSVTTLGYECESIGHSIGGGRGGHRKPGPGPYMPNRSCHHIICTWSFARANIVFCCVVSLPGKLLKETKRLNEASHWLSLAVRPGLCTDSINEVRVPGGHNFERFDVSGTCPLCNGHFDGAVRICNAESTIMFYCHNGPMFNATKKSHSCKLTAASALSASDTERERGRREVRKQAASRNKCYSVTDPKQLCNRFYAQI